VSGPLIARLVEPLYTWVGRRRGRAFEGIDDEPSAPALSHD